MTQLPSPKYQAASFFTGIGGLDLAAIAAGFEIISMSEINEYASRVLAHRFPDVPNLGDIRNVRREDIPGTPDLIFGGFPCFPAGTLILTSSGYIPIEDVTEGMQVLTHKNRWKPVVQTMSRKAPTVSLVGRGNSRITTTHEHPFFSRERCKKWDNTNRKYQYWFDKPKWTDAEAMKGKYWASPVNFPVSSIPKFDVRKFESTPCEFSTNFFWFVGAWLGDGWIRRSKRYGRNTNRTNDQVYICASYKEADELLERLHSIGFQVTASDDRTTRKFIITSKSLARWLSKYFGEKAGGKFLPSWVLGLPLEFRRSLLDGYLFADGNSISAGWRVTSINKTLLHGFKLLSQSLGYSTGIGQYAVPKQKFIEGRLVNQSAQWQLQIYRNPKTQFFIDGHIWGNVRKVENNSTTQTVYNIGVESDESYVADGIVVHNCQDISTASNGAGITGTRSGLYFELERVIGDVRPRLIVLENVANISVRGAERVVGGLSRIGYDGAWFTVPTQPQIPHIRRRWFYVGYANSNGQIRSQATENLQSNPGGDNQIHQQEHKRFPDAPRSAGGYRRAARGLRVQSRMGLKPAMGGAAHGISRQLDRHEFPAGSWQTQKSGEPPRLTPPIEDRANRVEVLGNAVVPQQALPIFRAAHRFLDIHS